MAELTDELPLYGCSLDADRLAEQRARYERLAAHVVASDRDQGRLEIRFDAAVDRDLLATALAVERECCPFFEIRQDGEHLEVGVADPRMEPALDAIAHTLATAP